MSVEPNRIRYNRDTAVPYILANGPFSRYPKVTEQIETVPIFGELKPYGYNGSIIEFRGKIFLAYRWHEVEYSTKISVAELDQTFTVVKDETLPLNSISAEDPRWFVMDINPCFTGALWISWVESNWPKEKWCVIKCSRFGGNGGVLQPRIGSNNGKGMEKNWVFFEHQGKLYCIYRCHPTQQIMQLSGAEVVSTHETEGPKWRYGEIRGGTLPLPYEGNFIRFFHSSLDNDLGPCRRRYFLGAYLMKSSPPFDPISVSKTPIVYGSELDNLTEEQREARKKLHVNMHQNTAIPYGVIERDGYWIVSLGVNDSACVLAKVRPADLHL